MTFWLSINNMRMKILQYTSCSLDQLSSPDLALFSEKMGHNRMNSVFIKGTWDLEISFPTLCL